MIDLNLPKADFKIKIIESKKYVFDNLRRKYVKLTPEEHVRQSFVSYLTGNLGYPAGLMGNEVSMTFNGMKFRCDTVLYDSFARPFMIIEYKAPDVTIDSEVLKQAYLYNRVLRVKYLVLSNGMVHYCFKIDYVANKIENIGCIPAYTDLER